MQFSIIIPVLNGEKHIGSCIDYIKQMETSNVKLSIIVVDNGSTDSTVKILQELNVDYIVDKDANLSGLRNLGASHSRGEYLGFVDSDCLVNKYWMIEAIKILQANERVGVVGRYYDMCDEPTWVERAWCARKNQLDGEVKYLPAGNMVVRRSLFDKLDGFSHNVLTGEDYELCQRVRSAGYVIINSSKVNTKHLGNVKTLRDVIKKERWYGLGMFSTLKNEMLSKPLIACQIFIILILGLSVTIFISKLYFLASLMLLVIFLSAISFRFTKDIKKNKLKYMLMFLPISFCYLLGRTFGLFDLFKKQRKRGR